MTNIFDSKLINKTVVSTDNNLIAKEAKRLNAEVITMESISEAFNKCFVSDFIFSISRTTEDKLGNTGRVFIAKNRNGPDGIIYPLFMDTSTVSIKILEPLEEGAVEVSSQAQKQKLAEKYKKFKKNNGG